MPIALVSNYLSFFTYKRLHAVQPDRYMLLLCICRLFFGRGGVFAFELGIGAIAAAALTRLMNRDRSLPGRQEAIAQNLITKGTTFQKYSNQPIYDFDFHLNQGPNSQFLRTVCDDSFTDKVAFVLRKSYTIVL